MKLKVIVLGSSSSVPTKDRNVTSLCLSFAGENFLFDCGEGTQRQLMKAKISYMKINNIFFSHLHADHILGLPGLLSTMQLQQRKNSLKIFGPKGLKKKVSLFVEIAGIKPGFEIEVIEFKQGKLIQEKNYSIETFKIFHSVACYGFVFQEKGKEGKFMRQKAISLGVPVGPLFSQLVEGKTVQIGGKKIFPKQVIDYSKAKPGRKVSFVFDTEYNDSYVQYIQNSDLLFHECTFDDSLEEKAKEKKHVTLSQACLAAKNSNSKKLVLFHFSPREKEEKNFEKKAKKLFKNTIAAKDLQKFEV